MSLYSLYYSILFYSILFYSTCKILGRQVCPSWMPRDSSTYLFSVINRNVDQQRCEHKDLYITIETLKTVMNVNTDSSVYRLIIIKVKRVSLSILFETVYCRVNQLQCRTPRNCPFHATASLSPPPISSSLSETLQRSNQLPSTQHYKPPHTTTPPPQTSTPPSLPPSVLPAVLIFPHLPFFLSSRSSYGRFPVAARNKTEQKSAIHKNTLNIFCIFSSRVELLERCTHPSKLYSQIKFKKECPNVSLNLHLHCSTSHSLLHQERLFYANMMFPKHQLVLVHFRGHMGSADR